LHVLLLELELEVLHGPLEFLVLKDPIAVEVECLEQPLQAEQTSFASLGAFLSNALEVVLKELGIPLLGLSLDFLNFLSMVAGVGILVGVRD